MGNITKEQNKIGVIEKDERLLNDIIWGSRLFVNAQLVCHLIRLLVAYNLGECTLDHLFRFTRVLQEQKKVKLYKEMKTQLEELICLEDMIKGEEITYKDTKVIHFTVNRMFWHFTGGKMNI